MDVSDFEADGEEDEVNGVDQGHSSPNSSPHPNAQYPEASPRPPPQPYPRHHQTAAPPYSYAPTSQGASRSPPPYQRSKQSPTLAAHKTNAYHAQQVWINYLYWFK